MRSFVTPKQRKVLKDIIGNFLTPVKHRTDSRNRRNIEKLIASICIKGSLRLKDLSQVFSLTEGGPVKRYLNRLSYLLNEARFNERSMLSKACNEVLLCLKREKAIKLHQGKAIVIIDPTFYYKRSRGKVRGMQYISYVKPIREGAKAKPGYTDYYASLLLKKDKSIPLVRKLSLPKEPGFRSHNITTEEVVSEALGKLNRINLKPILVADRGVANKRLIVKYRKEGKDFVFRTRKVNVKYGGRQRNILKLAKEFPPLGEIEWKEKNGKKEEKIKGEIKAFKAELTYYGSKKAQLNWVVVFPLNKIEDDPLIIATTLSIDTFFQAKEIVKIYEKRWSIETMIEYLKRGWGIDNFMVRTKRAIERALIFCNLAFMSLMILMYMSQKETHNFSESAEKILRHLSVLKKLTVGKLREAVSLDFSYHLPGWAAFF